MSAPPAGDYVVEVRMEIPHVDAWSWKSTRRVCLPNAGANLPIPVLSPNNSFGNCSAANIEGSGTRLDGRWWDEKQQTWRDGRGRRVPSSAQIYRFVCQNTGTYS